MVGSVSNKLLALANCFVQQDVLYGRTTKQEIRKLYYQKENGNFFDIITFGELTKEELEERLEEVKEYFSDDEGNLFLTEDLLNKHLLYKEKSNEKHRWF